MEHANADCSRREFLGLAALSGLTLGALSSGCSPQATSPPGDQKVAATAGEPEPQDSEPVNSRRVNAEPEAPNAEPASQNLDSPPKADPEPPQAEKPAETVKAKAHVVISRCHGCKYTDCVVVCPVDAFTEGEQMLYIDPELCINCEACVPECPVEAILSPDERMWSRHAKDRSYIKLNAEMAKKSPRIDAKKKPLAGPNCKAP